MKHFFRLPLPAIAGGLLLLLGCQKENTHDVGPKPVSSVKQNIVTPPQSPGECPDCPPEYVYQTSFYSTDGTTNYGPNTNNGAYNGPDNPNGYVLDIRTTYGSDNQEAIDRTPYGYVCLPANLNRNADGTIVFACFTRNPSRVIHTSADPNSGPVTAIRPYDGPGPSQNQPALRANENYLLAYSCPFLSDCGWQVADLNRGTHSAPITASVEHGPTATPIEVGIIYSQNANINPPAGWTKIPYDLNKFVGGGCDFVYFCYKNR